MDKKIDKYCFDKNFELFKNFVEQRDGSNLVSLTASHYFNDEEGYKDTIFDKARQELKYWDWNEAGIGNGIIKKNVINSIEIKNNNLAGELNKFGEKGAPHHKLIIEKKMHNIERIFFDFYHNEIADEVAFNKIIEYFGAKYPLVGYLFFIKDKSRYLPISPRRFQKSFQRLGVSDFQLERRCSWNNYGEFIKLNKQVQVLLNEKGLEATLLDAHSFIWLLEQRKGDIQKILNNKKYFDDLDNYKKLKPKQKEQVILARTGQGIFRKSLINYWQKCSITGCKKTELLIASHIKAFSSCSDEEAIDGQNGLLLIPNLDKLFDKCLISFDDDGKIIISSKLDEKTKNTFNITKDMRISKKLNSKQKEYLKYHRKNIN